MTDLVPSSDACHTERLTELQLGTSYAAELARLTRPLGVTHLALDTFTASAVAAWRRVRVLGAVQHLTLRFLFEDAPVLDLLTKTSIGAGVRELCLPWSATHAAEAPGWFARCPALERITLGEAVILTREQAGG